MKIPEWMFPTIPPHMREGLLLYLRHGVPPGGFLASVLANDFVSAEGRADHVNKEHLHHWKQLLPTLPDESWGSYEKISAWINTGGLEGQERGSNEVRTTDQGRERKVAGDPKDG